MTAGDALPGRPFSVLVVCTGNICRSPAAERLLRAGVPGPGLEVASAGTRARRGEPVAPPMARLLTGAGADVGGFRARQLHEGLLRSTDLVLTMTRQHRAEVVELWPRAVRRSFTLLELARLAALVAVQDLPVGSVEDRWRALVGLAAARRHEVRAAADVDDVADPYRGSTDDYQRSFEQISAAVTAVVSVLGSPAAPAASRACAVTSRA